MVCSRKEVLKLDIGEIRCPSCRREMTPVRLSCPQCDITVQGFFTISPLAMLPPEDQALAMAFIRSYGSIKQLQETMGVSYPTARARLDRLVAALNRTMEVDVNPRRTLNRLSRGEISFDEAMRSL